MAGFVADPGTDFSSGDERTIAQRLDLLAKRLGITIHGISGARTPGHSVAVGGYANDPHTHGAAADIGVNGSLRASASQLTDAQLASVGLYRPFPGAAEVNHVQLMPGKAGGGGLLSDVWGTVKDTLSPSGGPHDLTSKADQTIIDAANQGISSGLSDVGHAVGWGAKEIAKPVADELVNQAQSAIGKDLLRWTLYVGLVAGGVALAIVGGTRIAGAGPTPKGPSA